MIENVAGQPSTTSSSLLGSCVETIAVVDMLLEPSRGTVAVDIYNGAMYEFTCGHTQRYLRVGEQSLQRAAES